MNWPEVIGVLGFVLSVITFALTRWERRKNLTVDLLVDHGTRFRSEVGADNEDDLIIARFINDGQRPVVLDRDSFTFYGNRHPVKWHELDCLGRDTLPSPLNPGTHCEIGIFVDAFAHQVGAAPRSAVEISIEVKDLGGKRYLPRSTHTLLLEVNEI